MAKSDEKPEPISHDELGKLSRSDVSKNWNKIKRRLKASIPETPAEGEGDGDQGGKKTEPRTPRERMARAHAARETASKGGGNDGD